MPGKVMQKQSSLGYRPPQTILDTFWTLTEGNDKQRDASVLKLSQLTQSVKDEDKEQVLKYCKDRLVRGLSSGRKFARVGFAVALAQLLRDHHDIKADDVIATIKEKLKIARHEKKSKAEVGGIYLGRAFAFSTIIRSGRIAEMSGESIGQMAEELINMSEKKSYLKAVCNKTLEDLISQVSTDVFGEHVWTKIREKMKQGWDGCTLDHLSLLIACRENFSDIVNKKFLKKHWGFPILSAENDDNLLKSVYATAQKDAHLEQLVPFLLKDGRDVLSVWQGLGEKLCAELPEKKADLMAQRQLIGVKLASKLLASAKKDEFQELAMSPHLARCVFHSITKKNDPLASAADNLCQQLCSRLKSENGDVAGFVENIWELEESHGNGKKVFLVCSNNFTHVIDLMSKADAEKYAQFLMRSLKKDHSPSPATKLRELCLKQLQHIVCSRHLTSQAVQNSVLSLFLRLAYFRVTSPVKNIEHCETAIETDEKSPLKKLAESLLYKCLDSISTLNTGHQSKADKLSSYLELLYHLFVYVQTLMHSAKIQPVTPWPEGLEDEWKKLFEFVAKIKKGKEKQKEKDSAFLLLLMFLGLQMFADYKTVSELLKDVYVCYEKSSAGKKRKNSQDSEDAEPHWMEVITEVLLNLLSLQSHLGRTVSTFVFRSLSAHLTPAAVSLITEVLIPKSRRGDDAGGVLVDADNNENGEDMDEDDDEDDEDDASEEEEEDDDDDDSSSGDDARDDKAGDDNDEDDDEDEDEVDDNVVDEQFRQSVKEALGKAAFQKDEEDDDDNDDEELSDLSDSEMFKLDDMLAEVFRQRKKSGGKKAREEKRKETANFRLRVLDLVENMVKGERCGDFMLDFLKPILLLMMRTNTNEDVTVCDRSRGIFNQLRAKAKGMKDNVHTAEEQKEFFEDLLALARRVSDPVHLQPIATATCLVMCLSRSSSNGEESELSKEFRNRITETISNVITRKQPKPHVTYFTHLIETNPVYLQSLGPVILNILKDETTKVHSKTMCCSLLASLAKRNDVTEDDATRNGRKEWMVEAADVVSKMVLKLDKSNIKSMFIQDVLKLAIALHKWNDVFPMTPFNDEMRLHILEVKSKFSTDLKRHANKLVAAIERSRPKQTENGKKKKKKRKRSESQEVEMPDEEADEKMSKKRKNSESESGQEVPSPKKKKLKKER